MAIIHKLKYRYAIGLKVNNKFLSSLTKLVTKAKANICSTIKGNSLLYCRKISEFVAVVKI